MSEAVHLLKEEAKRWQRKLFDSLDKVRCYRPGCKSVEPNYAEGQRRCPAEAASED